MLVDLLESHLPSLSVPLVPRGHVVASKSNVSSTCMHAQPAVSALRLRRLSQALSARYQPLTAGPFLGTCSRLKHRTRGLPSQVDLTKYMQKSDKT